MADLGLSFSPSDDRTQARLFYPFSWRKTLFQSEKHNFGPTIQSAIAEIPMSDLVSDTADAGGLVTLVQRIQTALNAIDEAYIQHRADLLELSVTPGKLALISAPVHLRICISTPGDGWAGLTRSLRFPMCFPGS
jgi:hypothetical protein